MGCVLKNRVSIFVDMPAEQDAWPDFGLQGCGLLRDLVRQPVALCTEARTYQAGRTEELRGAGLWSVAWFGAMVRDPAYRFPVRRRYVSLARGRYASKEENKK